MPTAAQAREIQRVLERDNVPRSVVDAFRFLHEENVSLKQQVMMLAELVDKAMSVVAGVTIAAENMKSALDSVKKLENSYEE